MSVEVQLNCNVFNFDGTLPVLEIETNQHRYEAEMESPSRAIFRTVDEPPHGWYLEYGGKRERQPDPFYDETGSWEGPNLFYEKQSIDPPPIQPPVVIPFPSAPTQLVGRAWTRGGVPWYPWYWTLFWALGGWMRGDRARVEQHFRWMADKGSTGFRMLGQVDWPGEEIDPQRPDYEPSLAEMLDVAFNQYGLLAKITLVGGGVQDPLLLAQKVRNVTASRLQMVLMFEGVNEGNGTVQMAKTMLDVLRPLGLPMAAGFGNQGPEYINAASKVTGANVGCLHTERGGGDDRMLRQIWDLKDFAPLAADDGEGPGPGASAGGELSDPVVLAAKRAGAAAGGGGGAFCVHTGAGVNGRARPASPGREACPANIWETPRIEEIAERVRKAVDPLDLGMENWTRYNTGVPVRVAEGPFEKIYGGRALGRFGQLVTACRNPDGSPAGRVVFEGTGDPYRVWAPGGGVLAESQDGGRVEVGGYVAYIVQGDDN